jgi:hypothetical protein
MAVPEGGVGGPLGVTEQMDVGTAALKLWLLGAPRRVGFFIIVLPSRVRSSHSGHGVFSLTMMNGCLVLSEWCFSSLFLGS